MKLAILFNFLLITTVITAPRKRARRQSQTNDVLKTNYDPYDSGDICNNFVQHGRHEIECRSDAQTISFNINTELGSISVLKSFATTNAERKHPRRTYIPRYQGETYSSDTNSFSTSINLPHSSLSFTKSYRKVSGC